MIDDKRLLAFNDPRRFGQITLLKQGRLPDALSTLGPEPLADAFTADILRDRLKAKKTSIKAALLDQTVIAGIGNIYASEALFHARIHPERGTQTLKPAEIVRLRDAIVAVLGAAIEAGGSTLRDYRQPSGETGFFQDRFAVYDRAGEKCPGCTCARGIERMVQNGRSTFFCAKKQR
jgi:formamidopyrimidine-DNA glycosylase